MIQEEQRLAIKKLIETDNIKRFEDIFSYISKKQLQLQMGINYNRLLRAIKSPKLFSYDDSYRVASIFNVPHDLISKIINHQIDNPKSVAKKTYTKKTKE